MAAETAKHGRTLSFKTQSLSFRLALLAGAWVTAGLVLVWFLATGIVSQANKRTFDVRLVSLVDALAAATAMDDETPFLIRPVSEPRFDRPLSGFYYQIEGPSGALLTSRSLATELLPPGRTGHIGVLMDDIPGPRSQHLRLAERDIIPPNGAKPVHILVASAVDDMMHEDARTRELLGLGLLFLGIGVVGAVMLQVSVGLAGLRRLRGAVAELRVTGHFGRDFTVPSEIGPLVEEIDALVRQNRETVERARRHIGNLAHALRTRLSIMGNALDVDDVAVLRHELVESERLVQHHLARARTAALAGTAGADVSPIAVATDIAHALRLLFADRGLTIAVAGDPAVVARCEHADLAEMLGNLMENACKWAKSRVKVSVRTSHGQIIVLISDDGSGLSADQLREVRERGVRIDESVPGSGLGLAIATDLATLYGGSLNFVSPGPDGGLANYLILPAGRPLEKDLPR